MYQWTWRNSPTVSHIETKNNGVVLLNWKRNLQYITKLRIETAFAFDFVSLSLSWFFWNGSHFRFFLFKFSSSLDFDGTSAIFCRILDCARASQRFIVFLNVSETFSWLAYTSIRQTHFSFHGWIVSLSNYRWRLIVLSRFYLSLSLICIQCKWIGSRSADQFEFTSTVSME